MLAGGELSAFPQVRNGRSFADFMNGSHCGLGKFYELEAVIETAMMAENGVNADDFAIADGKLESYALTDGNSVRDNYSNAANADVASASKDHLLPGAHFDSLIEVETLILPAILPSFALGCARRPKYFHGCHHADLCGELAAKFSDQHLLADGKESEEDDQREKSAQDEVALNFCEHKFADG